MKVGYLYEQPLRETMTTSSMFNEKVEVDKAQGYYSLHLVRPEQVYTLRHKVLRPRGTLDECVFEGDDLESTLHCAVMMSGRVVAILSLYQQGHELFEARNPYQLRGMACDPNFRGRGFGRALIGFAIEKIVQEQADLLWFNARTSAKSFYSELEFDITGEEFDIPAVGRHIVMYKKLG